MGLPEANEKDPAVQAQSKSRMRNITLVALTAAGIHIAASSSEVVASAIQNPPGFIDQHIIKPIDRVVFDAI